MTLGGGGRSELNITMMFSLEMPISHVVYLSLYWDPTVPAEERQCICDVSKSCLTEISISVGAVILIVAIIVMVIIAIVVVCWQR